ncbi:MAG: hypothetical protein GF313_13040 [Caldithrix sp.]|nr:hypothetical protein [Caldithrix sp.]
MAEQSRKSYITAREFIEAWEKEIYELNNLDYFIYLLINELASSIELQYFVNITSKHLLYLNREDIGNLSFSIGDSLQVFLERNCFNSCPLQCPSNLNDPVNQEEEQIRNSMLLQFMQHPPQCKRKDECLYTDLLNYVVLDSLLDFYNYEMNIVLSENDKRLLKFAEFIMHIVINIIRKKGQDSLNEPKENASEKFSTMLYSDDNTLLNLFADEPEDDEMVEGDEWKLSSNGVDAIIEEFKESYDRINSDDGIDQIFDNFGEFITNFLAISKIDELHIEDIEEYFNVILLNDITVNEHVSLDDVKNAFLKFIEYLEFNDYASLVREYKQFIDTDFSDVERVLTISVDYQRKHPLVNYLLQESKNKEKSIEGFFEVKSVHNNIAKLEDIHLKAAYRYVDVSKIGGQLLKQGDILHVELTYENHLWSVSHVLIVYPAKAKFYLY